MLWLSTVETPRPETEETEETVETVETVVVGLFVVCHIEHRTVCCRSSPSSVCLFPLFLVFHCGFAFVQSTAKGVAREELLQKGVNSSIEFNL